MKTKQEFIATATHSQTHGRIEFTGTEALTELLGRFGSGKLVYLYAADTLERLTTERSEDEVLAETDRYRSEVARLTTERDALAKDAERYRYCREVTQFCDWQEKPEELDARVDRLIRSSTHD